MTNVENDGPPLTVEQMAGALVALGYFQGENTPEAHAYYAARHKNLELYRMGLLNSLLGAVQAEAMTADFAYPDDEEMQEVWPGQLISAGVAENDLLQANFIAWQLWRASFPLSVFARSGAAGPVAVAAAYSAESSNLLTTAMAAGFDAVQSGDVDSVLTAQQQMLTLARERLTTALENVDAYLVEIEQRQG
ncbi:DUF6245 family protein [Kitasatospora sp. NPDC051853]|uniref:DUF6245 family protein n=1 Tax=Kitasatospora sp. NPDC051853 TaxID=3364058 RepID=UPI00378B606E